MTDEERDQIRESVDIGELIGEDVELRQRGGRLWGRCPFHEERTPSFAVDPARGAYYCFGCHAHGDVFEYLMRAKGLTFPEAVEALASRAGITLSTPKRKGVSRDRVAKALEAAAVYAREALEDLMHGEASKTRAWLKRRGISDDAIRRWGIGLTTGRGEMMRALRNAGFTNEELRAAGIRGDHGETLRHALCVPVKDVVGRIVGLAIQTMEACPSTSATTVGPLRPKDVGPMDARGVAPFVRGALLGMDVARDAIRETGRAIVALGPLDVVALHEAGIANAVSTIGGGLGARQARSLVAAGAREVTLLYPDDTHIGEAAAVASLPQAFMVTKVAWAPADVGDLMQREGVSKDKFLRACDAAGGLLEGVVGRVAERCDLDDPGRLLEGVREACGLLAFAANRDEARAHILASSIADRFGVRDVDALMGPLLDGTQIGDESWRTERARDAHPHAVEAWKLEHRTLSADALCSHGATRSPAQRVTARKPMEGVKVAGEGFRVGYAHANRGIAAQLLEETRMRRDNVGTTYGAGNLRPALGIRHNEGMTMDERQIIMISRGLGEPRGVSLATKEEIQRMGDLQAIAKIDELRDAAKEAENVGLVGEACTLYANACDIVENNLIVPEVIGEYADMLEAHGMSEQAAEYRAWHEEFTKVLAEYDLPARSYEARLRDQVAQASQGAAGRDNPGEQSVRRERLGDAVAQAQSAARAIEAPAGHALPSVTRAGA